MLKRIEEILERILFGHWNFRHHDHCFHHEDKHGKWFFTVSSNDERIAVSITGGIIMLQLSDSLVSTLGVILVDAGGNPANLTGVTVAFTIDNAAVGSLVPNATNPNAADFTPGADLADVGTITAAISINGALAFSVPVQVQVVSGAPASGTVVVLATAPLPVAPVTSAVKKA